MVKEHLNEKVNLLLDQEKWEAARNLLESARVKNPRSHWILTQLAVTFYEERQYVDALKLLLASLEIKDDCPLTLWNLAGTLDALDRHDEAQGIFIWILKSERTPKDDPCWESATWTATLKADSVFRLGDIAMHRGDKSLAERFYRDYLDLWLAGIKGSYSIEEVVRDVQQSRGANTSAAVKKTSQQITASGTIPRSILKQTAEIYSPVVKLEAFLQGKHGEWQQVVGQSSRRVASVSVKRKPTSRAKKIARRTK